MRGADPPDEALVLEEVVGPCAAGTRTISGSGRSSNAPWASMPSMPLSVWTTPGSWASQVTLAPGSRESTS